LIPNPEVDSIGFISFTIFHHKPPANAQVSQSDDENSLFETSLIIFDQERRSLETTRYLSLTSVTHLVQKVKKVLYVYKEEELFTEFMKAIHFYDPDILVGFELQKLSWCFLIRRAMRLNVTEFCIQISRLPKSKRDSQVRVNMPKERKGNQKGAPTVDIYPVPHELCIAGRVVLNLWRVLRSEISLNIYTFENCSFHILKERVPKFNYSTLTSWFVHKSDLFRWKTVEYYLHRSKANVRLLNSLDLIGIRLSIFYES
jgi:DNA polymerase elongation subunit (family B)